VLGFLDQREVIRHAQRVRRGPRDLHEGPPGKSANYTGRPKRKSPAPGGALSPFNLSDRTAGQVTCYPAPITACLTVPELGHEHPDVRAIEARCAGEHGRVADCRCASLEQCARYNLSRESDNPGRCAGARNDEIPGPPAFRECFVIHGTPPFAL